MQLRLSAPEASLSMPRYAVNPMPPPSQRPSWIRRHGKDVAVGAAVVGGLVIAGAVVWTVVQAVTGNAQPPACTALQNQLTQLQAQEFSIYRQASAQGGTFTAAQAAEVQSLQSQISATINQMSQVCIAPPGATLEQWINKAIVFAGWAALAILGIVAVGVSALVIRWFYRRWGGSSSNAEAPPRSVDDVSVSPEFNQATMGTDTANGSLAGNVAEGKVSTSDASSIATNLSASDPAIGVAGTISAFFANAASAASEAAQALLQALATLWDYIVSALSDLAFEFTLYLS